MLSHYTMKDIVEQTKKPDWTQACVADKFGVKVELVRNLVK